LRTVTMIAAALLVATTASAASEQTPWIGVRGKALDTIQTRDCGAVRCEAASAAERAAPPVSDLEAQIAYQRGVYSGAAEHCGLDGQTRNYAPMMAWWRTTRHMNVRQIALVGAIHDIAKGMAKTAMGRIGACTTDTKADIDRRLDFRAPASR
jgi:hypothetical protein